MTTDFATLAGRTRSERRADDHSAADFSLGLGEVFTSSGRTIPDARAVVRQDTGEPLAVVGTRYTVIQPAEVMELAGKVASDQGMAISKVSVLGRGRDLVVRAQGPEYQQGGDTLRRESWVRANNTGRAPVQVSAGVWRKVCSNGLFVMIRGSVSLRIRHTRSGADRVRELLQIGESVRLAHETAEQTINRLMARTVNHKGGELAAYYEKVLPRPTPAAPGASRAEQDAVAKELERVNATRRDWLSVFLRELDTRGTGAAAGPNLWLALNSVTNWTNHRMPIRGARQNPERRAYANLPDGQAAELAHSAYAAAVAMA